MTFTGMNTCSTQYNIPNENNIIWKDLLDKMKEKEFEEKSVLIDVRPENYFKIS